MKKISDQKLQAFTAGSMGARNLSKRELEDLRKKEEEEAAAHVFKEFVETFQEAPSTTSKVWVKAGTYDAGARKEDNSERGKLYKPTSRIEEKRTTVEDVVRSFAPRQDSPRVKSKISNKDKKKSNLELFKEELRQIQEERSERHKFKTVLRDRGAVPEPTMDMPDVGSYDTGDPNTTNLYLGNLNPKITEQQLMEIFGRYGPLASIKIMWPRSDEEKARGRNCGFVAFMSRKDGERALRCINGKEILNYEMKLGWGKAVVIPPVPIYIPPSLQQPSKPPPPSGLPFNAQPPKHLINKIPRVRPGEYYPSDPDDKDAYETILSQSIVKVVLPVERNIVMLIHRMVEFVIREGPMFEAIIMNKEMNNPFFRFLFENQSPAHVYYRWKLFSMLQGDSTKQWAPNDFRMFKGGSVWRPPVLNLYTAGMPDELVDEDEAKDIRGTLSNSQRDRLEQLIRSLEPSRSSVAASMAWCVEHAEAARDVARLLHDSLSQPTTQPARRLARLYLLCDVLHNAAATLPHAANYRSAFQPLLVDIMRELHQAWSRLQSRLQQEGFRARVLRVLQSWADCQLYPAELLQQLHLVFLGQEKEAMLVEAAAGAASPSGSTASSASSCAGAPLDGAALRRLAAEQRLQPPAPAPAPALAAHAPPNIHDDIDGVPVEEDIDGVPLEAGSPGSAGEGGAGGFVPSRWESVAPPTPPSPGPAPDTPQHNDDTPTQQQREGSSEGTVLSRATLRDIEVRVLQYADRLETSRSQRRLSAPHHLHSYRKKLIKKAIKEAKELEARESPEPAHREDDVFSTTSSKKSKKSREPSLSPPPKKSRHSERKSRSRSRSRSREKERDRDRSREKDKDREREREKRRRSPTTPPTTHHHRKHSKHSKYKY